MAVAGPSSTLARPSSTMTVGCETVEVATELQRLLNIARGGWLVLHPRRGCDALEILKGGNGGGGQCEIVVGRQRSVLHGPSRDKGAELLREGFSEGRWA